MASMKETLQGGLDSIKGVARDIGSVAANPSKALRNIPAVQSTIDKVDASPFGKKMNAKLKRG